MPSAVEECHEPSGNCQEFHIVWRVVTLIIQLLLLLGTPDSFMI